MIGDLFKALAAGLTLWQHKDAREYLDLVIKLRKEWYEEYNKEVPIDSVLDNIELQLQHICDAFSSNVGIPYITDQ